MRGSQQRGFFVNCTLEKAKEKLWLGPGLEFGGYQEGLSPVECPRDYTCQLPNIHRGGIQMACTSQSSKSTVKSNTDIVQALAADLTLEP